MTKRKAALLATLAGALFGGSYPTVRMVLFIVEENRRRSSLGVTVADAINHFIVAIPVFTILGAAAGFALSQAIRLVLRGRGNGKQ